MDLGIDTHTRYSQLAIVDDHGTLQDELRIPHDRLDELAEQYAGREAAIEATGHYRPIYNRLDDEIEAKMLESEAAQLLLSIPGVGQSTAAVVIAEVGEIERFDRHEDLVSYAGLDPMGHHSGDTEVHGSISKDGPAPLRWALIQAAHVSVRYDEYLGNFYTRLKHRKNHQIPIVATAQKLLASRFSMLQRRELYDPPEVSP